MFSIIINYFKQEFKHKKCEFIEGIPPYRHSLSVHRATNFSILHKKLNII